MAKTKARTRSRRQWSRMTRERYLTEQLREAHDDLEGARTDRSWQAVSHLRRQALLVRKELDELEAERSREAAQQPAAEEELSDDELMAALRAAVAELPDAQLDELLDAIEARRCVQPADDDGDDYGDA